MKEPTGDECQTHATWTDEYGFTYLAFFWPQMGGYFGKAVARREPKPPEDYLDDYDSCVVVWIWHDGAFPFGEEQGKNPAVLHICDFSDWLESMQMLERFQYGEEIEEVKVEHTIIPELTDGKK